MAAQAAAALPEVVTRVDNERELLMLWIDYPCPKMVQAATKVREDLRGSKVDGRVRTTQQLSKTGPRLDQ